MKEIRAKVTAAFNKHLLFTPHSAPQMNRLERMISVSEVREALVSGAVIEDYPDDKRGHSCLIMGYTSENRPLHVVCSPKEEYLAVITVYVPDNSMWNVAFTKRTR